MNGRGDGGIDHIKIEEVVAGTVVLTINDFERGGLRENTPYEPLRNGYTFGGWYKESECVKKWNFEIDTLLTATYDEDGNVIDFIETKLYGKWTKIKK